MADGVDQNATAESRVVETPSGTKEFRGTVEHRDPNAPTLTPAPDGIPEKFWDAEAGKLRTEDLLKSYGELEKKVGQPKAEAEGGDEPAAEDEDEQTSETDGEDEQPPAKDDEEKPGEDEDEKSEAPELTSAIEAAQAAYAETGELTAEAREPLLKAGITDQQIDFYIQGVKATERALESAAYKAAGSEDDLRAAMAWAAEGNWTEKQVRAFNSQMGDVETVGPAVAGLMAAFKTANPGEGRLQNINSSVSHGDVYSDMADFQKDLLEADTRRDQAARRKAVDKLRRSKAAGTIKSNRRQPFGR